MENAMSISYETVLYAGGTTRVARGFAQLHYDRSPSPLTPAGGGTNSILGPGGIVNVLDEVITDGSGGNWGSAAFKLVRGYDKNKNVDLTNLAKGELTQAFTNVLRGGSFQSALNQTYIPYRGAFTGPSFQSALNPQTLAAAGSVSSNGFNITAGAAAITGGFASALSGTPSAALGADLSGVITNAQGVLAGADLNKVVDLSKGAANQLVATASNLIPPPSSYAAQIQQAQQGLRQIADSSAFKTLQESVGKDAAFLQQNIQSAATTFQTGTNTIVQQASSALANTPFKDLQFPTANEVASKLSLNNFNAPSAATYFPTSTNPIP
jgi:hypothetical protein